MPLSICLIITSVLPLLNVPNFNSSRFGENINTEEIDATGTGYLPANQYTDVVYCKPYCRIPTYLVGMVLGYFIYKTGPKKLSLHPVSFCLVCKADADNGSSTHNALTSSVCPIQIKVGINLQYMIRYFFANLLSLYNH